MLWKGSDFSFIVSKIACKWVYLKFGGLRKALPLWLGDEHLSSSEMLPWFVQAS